MSTSPLSDANWSIRRARRRYVLGRFERWRITNPIRVIDEMLGEVEEMNLRHARRVPITWEPRLALLAANLPPSVCVDPAELRAGISPNRLMEALFTLQDQLFDLKIGPFRRWLRQEEEIEEMEELREMEERRGMQETQEAPGLPPAA
jgi:hypothetical protein